MQQERRIRAVDPLEVLDLSIRRDTRDEAVVVVGGRTPVDVRDEIDVGDGVVEDGLRRHEAGIRDLDAGILRRRLITATATGGQQHRRDNRNRAPPQKVRSRHRLPPGHEDCGEPGH